MARKHKIEIRVSLQEKELIEAGADISIAPSTAEYVRNTVLSDAESRINQDNDTNA